MLEIAPYGKPKFTVLKKWWLDLTAPRSETAESHRQPLLQAGKIVSLTIPDKEDEDVAAERQRVLDGNARNAMICLCNLRKVLLKENTFLSMLEKWNFKSELDVQCLI